MAHYVAVLIYVLSFLYGLKALSDLLTGKAAAQDATGQTGIILGVCILIGVAAWIVDRRYCGTSRKHDDHKDAGNGQGGT